MRHIHLDLVGGLAGDMFIAVLLDCFPQHARALAQVMAQAGFNDLVELRHCTHNDGTLTGSRFEVSPATDGQAHHHRHYSDIRQILNAASMPETTRSAALAIFKLIAEVEAKIHGKSIDSIAFHEVGAWDSIADIVCAAWLIETCEVTSWSVSKLPLGRGRIKTAHGLLPIPAPATALLLEGFEFFDDGLEGERITPTGAAILKFLVPKSTVPEGFALDRSGFGFGLKKFPGISNVVRAMIFESEESSLAWQADQVLLLEFEVDDQTPEDLAVALEKLRLIPGVIDVLQSPVFGKKNRQGSSVRVIVLPADRDALISACFTLTTTLGIRHRVCDRSILRRSHYSIDHEGDSYRVKVAARPLGPSAKAEMDDMKLKPAVRAAVESAALARFRDDNG